MPMLIGIDAVNNLIALEDLGKTNDYSVLYDLEQKNNGRRVSSIS
jgi:5-methylthioribose kinase